jgi:hypothetical protein
MDLIQVIKQFSLSNSLYNFDGIPLLNRLEKLSQKGVLCRNVHLYLFLEEGLGVVKHPHGLLNLGNVHALVNALGFHQVDQLLQDHPDEE